MNGMIPKFNIGDKVWYARNENVAERIICDCCQGKRYLMVIMGDESRVTIECTGCQSGYDPPKGYNIVYNQIQRSVETTIYRIEINENEIEYYTRAGCGVGRVFSTKREADKKAKELGEKYYKEQIDRLEKRKENEKRSWAWNATYHKQQIKKAQKDLEYHTKKLHFAKIIAKETNHAK